MIWINLLSSSEKRNLLLVIISQTLNDFIFLFLAIIPVSIILFSSLLHVVEQDYEQIQKQIELQTYIFDESNGDIVQKVKTYNRYLGILDTYQSNHIDFSKVYLAITNPVKNDITIQDINYSNKENQFLIKGVSATRVSLVDYINQLEDIPYISSIVSPLSNLTDETNIRFDLSFIFDECMYLEKGTCNEGK